jgi:hypothetical protein
MDAKLMMTDMEQKAQDRADQELLSTIAALKYSFGDYVGARKILSVALMFKEPYLPVYELLAATALRLGDGRDVLGIVRPFIDQSQALREACAILERRKQAERRQQEWQQAGDAPLHLTQRSIGRMQAG